MPTASTSTLPVRKSLKRARPKGLWKARASVANGSRCCAPDVPKVDLDSDSDGVDDWDTTSSESAFKRRRYSPSIPSSESASDSEDTYRWDFSQRQTCRLDNQPLSFFERQTGWTRRQRVMDTSSTAFGGSQTEARTECSYEDWLDLKDLFRKAAEQYEEGSADEALPLLRGVIHECHSFLNMYDDPSTLFAAPKSPTDTPTPEWVPGKLPRKCKCVELPTAFHAILGTALFLFGNLIDHDGSLSLPGEPNTPMPYWLAALDVFETGENLPSRVYGTGCDAPEDWRMAIVWGRTLVALADATVLRAHEQPDAPAIFDVEDSHWSSDSPFAAIAMRRPPLTRRMSLSGTSPNDLLMLAMDQFSRGIFHMPHPQHQLDPRMFPLAAAACADVKMDAPTGGGCHGKRVASAPPGFSTLPAFAEHSSKSETFSRPKELYTIASEVLLLAEKLPNPSERKYWACWADSVLNQMKMEADMDAWRGTISRARGKCWLIAGSAHADDLEDGLENEDHDVRTSPQAEEARVGLEKAIGFLDKGRSDVEEEEKERKGMLAEALLTLSNLTLDPELAKLLFRRGEEEGGEHFMDVDA